MRRTSSLAVVAGGALIAFWFGVATVGGVGGGGHPVSPHLPGMPEARPAPTEPAPTERVTPTPAPTYQGGNGLPHWLGDLLRVVGTLAVVLVVALVVLRIVRAVRVDVPSDAQGESVTGPHRPTVDVDELRSVTDDSLARLRADGDIAAAITACWRRLEDLAARSGAPRESWQSTQEYVVEVLGHTPAPGPAVEQLAEAYRAVCYSGHQPQEADRRSAIASLEAITASLDGAR